MPYEFSPDYYITYSILYSIVYTMSYIVVYDFHTQWKLFMQQAHDGTGYTKALVTITKSLRSSLKYQERKTSR